MTGLSFQCEPIEHEGEPGLRFIGSAHSTDADIISRKLQEAAAPAKAVFYLDLSAARLLDSAALGAIVLLHNSLKANGRKLVILAPSATCMHVLQITALNRVLNIVE